LTAFLRVFQRGTIETAAVLAVLAVTRHLVGAPGRAIAYRRGARPLRGRLHGSHVVRARDGLRLRVDLGDIAGAMLATSGVWSRT
jgi:hypothetical protein